MGQQVMTLQYGPNLGLSPGLLNELAINLGLNPLKIMQKWAANGKYTVVGVGLKGNTKGRKGRVIPTRNR